MDSQSRQAYYLLVGEQRVRVPPDGTPIRLGRLPDNDLVLNDTETSRRHAEVRCRGGALEVRDLRSMNGTLLDGHRIVPEFWWKLDPQQTLRVGPSAVLIEVSEHDDPEDEEDWFVEGDYEPAPEPEYLDSELAPPPTRSTVDSTTLPPPPEIPAVVLDESPLPPPPAPTTIGPPPITELEPPPVTEPESPPTIGFEPPSLEAPPAVEAVELQSSPPAPGATTLAGAVEVEGVEVEVAPTTQTEPEEPSSTSEPQREPLPAPEPWAQKTGDRITRETLRLKTIDPSAHEATRSLDEDKSGQEGDAPRFKPTMIMPDGSLARVDHLPNGRVQVSEVTKKATTKENGNGLEFLGVDGQGRLLYGVRREYENLAEFEASLNT